MRIVSRYHVIQVLCCVLNAKAVQVRVLRIVFQALRDLAARNTLLFQSLRVSWVQVTAKLPASGKNEPPALDFVRGNREGQKYTASR
jgi:hypothetical protein